MKVTRTLQCVSSLLQYRIIAGIVRRCKRIISGNYCRIYRIRQFQNKIIINLLYYNSQCTMGGVVGGGVVGAFIQKRIFIAPGERVVKPPGHRIQEVLPVAN